MSCISFVFIAPPSNTWITESGQKPNVISVIERHIQAHLESVVKSPFWIGMEEWATSWWICLSWRNINHWNP